MASVTKGTTNRFTFLDYEGMDVAPPDWMEVWAARFPSDKYNEEQYNKSLRSAPDFMQIGRWKDAAVGGRWKSNVASVAYDIWTQAAREPPPCPDESQAVEFLNNWSERTYSVGKRQIRFGPPRATTILHFISEGRFPIFDSRVRRAMRRLLSFDTRVHASGGKERHVNAPNSVRWYWDSYRPLFKEVTVLCAADNERTVDKALFAYGDRNLFPHSQRNRHLVSR